MIRRLPFCSLFFLTLLLAGPCIAQPAQTAEETTQADSLLQPPSAFLGYTLGERFTPHHRAVAYARHVAAASPRARLTRYGTTPEGRPLLQLVLSTPENLARADAIRRAHLQRTGLADTTAGAPVVGNADPDGAGAERKAIVWLSYNVHGDEAVSTEAALKTLYALADAANERTGRWLDETLVVLDPCLNPDGRARYVQWYRQTRGRQPDARPAAREHAPPWPSGRTNHYLFDLNRDWAWGTQQETRARLAQYHRWMPHVHADFHEQSVDAPYYFAPGAEPMHEALTPFQQSFQRTMGQANAAIFDRQGWLYFTGEVFDLFYPGYGDTWPLFNGAIGMTYEQGGGGRAGLLIETAADSLSLEERIAHHYATGLTTVRTAAQEREALTTAFADYFRSAQAEPPGETAAYVMSGSNADRRRALTRLLDRQHIRYAYAAEAGPARGESYQTGETERFSVEAGDLVVPAAQPKARLVQVLFERQPALSDSLTYDITAWALPYAFGMETYAAAERPDVRTRSTAPAPSLPGGATSAAEGDDARAPYAYLAEWKSLADARLLARLLEKDVQVRIARAPFAAGGRRWGRGTLVVMRTDNEPLHGRFAEVMQAAAQDQPLVPLQTGLTTSGPDLGAASVVPLKKPAVAVLAGAGLSPSAVGEAWHLFDQRLRYPATLLAAAEARPSVLRDFDVLVLPSGDYEEVFSERGGAPSLRRWVENGGRLVAVGGAAGFLAEAEGFTLARQTTEAPAVAAKADTTAGGAAGGSPSRRYERRERVAASGRVPGAIFRTRLDPTHPLAYGYQADTYYTLKRGARAFAPIEDGWNVAVLPPDDEGTPASGFAGARAQRQLAGALVFGVEAIGEGHAVYLADDPLFRGFWQGGALLFSNAVFMVGQ